MNLVIIPRFNTQVNSQLQQTRTNNFQTKQLNQNLTFGMVGKIDLGQVRDILLKCNKNGEARNRVIYDAYDAVEAKLDDSYLLNKAKTIIKRITNAESLDSVNVNHYIPGWDGKVMEIKFLNPNPKAPDPLLIPYISLDGITQISTKGFSIKNDDAAKELYIDQVIEDWMKAACEKSKKR